MSCLLGIDIGTSIVKVVAFDVDGGLKGIGLAEYPILTPHLGHAEQDPEHWWRATVAAVRESLDKGGRPEVLGIGLSGQMHGLVLLDKGGDLVRPAIIWADQRIAGLLPEIEGRVGRSLLAQRCGTAPRAGFAIASLYWLQKFEAQTLEPAAALMLPKDYLRLKLTGEVGTVPSYVLSRVPRPVVPPGSDVVGRHGAEMAPLGAGKGRGVLRGTRSTGCGGSCFRTSSKRRCHGWLRR